MPEGAPEAEHVTQRSWAENLFSYYYLIGKG